MILFDIMLSNNSKKQIFNDINKHIKFLKKRLKRMACKNNSLKKRYYKLEAMYRHGILDIQGYLTVISKHTIN